MMSCVGGANWSVFDSSEVECVAQVRTNFASNKMNAGHASCFLFSVSPSRRKGDLHTLGSLNLKRQFDTY